MNPLAYKGYIATIEPDLDDGIPAVSHSARQRSRKKERS